MLKLVFIAIVLTSLLSLSTSRPNEENNSLDNEIEEEKRKDVDETEEDEVEKKKKASSDIPYLPEKPLDCGDPNLRVLGQILCVDINNMVKGVKSPDHHDADILDNPKHHRSRRVVQERTKWPKSSDGFVYIPYTFGTSLRNVTEAFMQAVNDFNRLSCIRLIPRQSHHQDYIYLFSGTGCYTYIGRRGGRQPLSLQSYTACATKGVAVHEILHVLGFFHEMSRRDRDQHIDINFRNIYSSVRRQFNMHLVGDGSVMGMDYDVGSVMQYGNYAGAINKLVRTITSKRNPNERLGQRNGMSRKDLIQLNRVYECEAHVTRL